MTLLNLGRQPIAGAAVPILPATPDRDEAGRSQALLARLGAEIAGPLTAAVERINTLSSTGKIDRESLGRLRDEVQAARQAGIIGQQLTRFSAGRIRQSHERLQLADAVEQVLAHRQRQVRAKGTRFQPSLRPVEIVCDASLLASLLDSIVDWAMTHADSGSEIDLSIDARSHAAPAILSCRFAARAADPLADPATGGPGDSLIWHLIHETARAMALRIERSSHRHGATGRSNVQLTIEFPRTVAVNRTDAGQQAGVTGFGVDDGFAASANSQPLAGSHVLVIASRREMRTAVRDALRRMSLIVDFVNSVDEAAAFCREGLPHAIVIESIQNGERFRQWSEEIRAELPGFAFIEIVEEGKVFEMSGSPSLGLTRVGRDALANSLPQALMFELSKSL